ncbi:MAG: PilZ domain-containing protein [Oligoflexales bacterium]
MASALSVKDLRQHKRLAFKGVCDGKLVAVSDGREITFQIKDYSMGGLGITTVERILPDVNFVFKMNSCEVPLILIWGLAQNDEQGTHRYGFMAKTNAIDLVKLLHQT